MPCTTRWTFFLFLFLLHCTLPLHRVMYILRLDCSIFPPGQGGKQALGAPDRNIHSTPRALGSLLHGVETWHPRKKKKKRAQRPDMWCALGTNIAAKKQHEIDYQCHASSEACGTGCTALSYPSLPCSCRCLRVRWLLFALWPLGIRAVCGLLGAFRTKRGKRA